MTSGLTGRCVLARSRLSKAQVADAFLASLTSGRLDWRSGLGSFAVSLNLPAHTWSASGGSPLWCPICGSSNRHVPEDLNVLSFERLKWGGVRHADAPYIGFTVNAFSL